MTKQWHTTKVFSVQPYGEREEEHMNTKTHPVFFQTNRAISSPNLAPLMITSSVPQTWRRVWRQRRWSKELIPPDLIQQGKEIPPSRSVRLYIEGCK